MQRPLLVSNYRTKDVKFPAFTPTFYTFRFVLACCSSRLSIISPGICVVLSFSIMTPYAMDMTTIGTKQSTTETETKYAVRSGMVNRVMLPTTFISYGQSSSHHISVWSNHSRLFSFRKNSTGNATTAEKIQMMTREILALLSVIRALKANTIPKNRSQAIWVNDSTLATKERTKIEMFES